jgi:hypothetical protein
MRWAAIWLAGLSGCSSILGIDDFKLGDAGGGDMEGGNEYCLGPTGFRVCLAEAPTGAPFTIPASLTFDTGTSPQCASVQPASWKMASQPDACFIIAPQITISGNQVQAIGARPLVLFASDSITITTQLDAASHNVTSVRGPASNAAACTAGTMGPGGSTTGGGGGGSFLTRGGDGGNSSGNTAGGRASAADQSAPTLLRGGCNGKLATTNVAGVPGGDGGAGGGAVYLLAGNRITINGFINVSGAAGGGGQPGAGGGGGGSGGMILLHAPAIGGNGGVLIANGGAGGGAGGGGGQSGQPGSDPSPQMPTMQALGGTPGSGAGAGGLGFAGSAPATIGQNAAAGATGGGGGGGGAGGYIRANIAPSNITSSPTVSILP